MVFASFAVATAFFAASIVCVASCGLPTLLDVLDAAEVLTRTNCAAGIHRSPSESGPHFRDFSIARLT
jgi:hypothetical protein